MTSTAATPNAVWQPGQRIVGVSLKMYFSAARTRAWSAGLGAALTGRSDGAGEPAVFVLPSFPLIEATVRALRGTGVRVGSQNVVASEHGAQTGEVSAALLRELGCDYVAVGHAERRASFGEDDIVVAAKAGLASRHAMVPVVCVGEPIRTDVGSAVAFCLDQLQLPLAACAGAPVLVAYEPVWAIGAAEAAAPAYVREVCSRLRGRLESHHGPSALLYGGSAGPGTLTGLADAVDGVFLGRFAHDLSALTLVLDEARALAPSQLVSAYHEGRP